MPIHDHADRSPYDRTEDRVALLSVTDLAKMMQISTRTVWRLLSVQKLPEPIRIGGSVRWRRADVDVWLSAGCPIRQ